jgi:hypothetical protein
MLSPPLIGEAEKPALTFVGVADRLDLEHPRSQPEAHRAREFGAVTKPDFMADMYGQAVLRRSWNSSPWSGAKGPQRCPDDACLLPADHC